MLPEADVYLVEELVEFICEKPSPDKRSLEDFCFGYTEFGQEVCAEVLNALQKQSLLNYDYLFTKCADGSRRQHTFVHGRDTAQTLFPIALKAAEDFCHERDTA